MQLKHDANRIYAADAEGTLLAEITFPTVAEGTVDINRTFVDSSLRGQGAAALLVEQAVQAIRQNGWKARLTCSYAAKWFGEHPEAGDILLDTHSST